ncbi:hypothetical protein CDD82_4523 [Ophiocordyceps australis]|uniref:MPN domain-containing protein n=1 Tax=Ophiocordyceps australis TaxID=1399860 RepID=A0A2C5Z632_9HYPO|nr:hypothetical protein CDD82_4523 [Ophiocordyceps australis]
MHKLSNEMESHSSTRPARPQSVKELVAQAENFNYNANIGFKQWARAAETLDQEATFAMSDGDYGRAYVMLYRHSLLVLDCLPSHPQFKDPESRKTHKLLAKRTNRVIGQLEHIKPILDDDYAEWERMSAAGKPEKESLKPPTTYQDFSSRDPSLTRRAKVLDAAQNQDLAVDLAQKELARRDEARRTTPILAGPQDTGFEEQDDLQQLMKTARQTLNPKQQGEIKHQGKAGGGLRVAPTYNYPLISKSKPIDYSLEAGPPSRIGPNRPPKEDLPPQGVADTWPRPPEPEPVPASVVHKLPWQHEFEWQDEQPLVSHAHGPRSFQPQPVPANAAHKWPWQDVQAPMSHTRGPSSFQPEPAPANVAHKLPWQDVQAPVSAPRGPRDAPLPPPKHALDKPTLPRKERLAFKPGAYLENGDPLRSVFLPSDLRETFLQLASKNTRAGLEMCGVLCGTPVNNALFVQCLVIPDQTCTSDTCETENEEALFDYCTTEGWLVLGWIHTHPTQTCFMSSRDLHTHAGYQVMMPESIAIVCAPRFQPSYGIFRLTHPPGLNHILDCRQSNTFHHHSISNIYRDTEHPDGHVYESDKMTFIVHDLRTK